MYLFALSNLISNVTAARSFSSNYLDAADFNIKTLHLGLDLSHNEGYFSSLTNQSGMMFTDWICDRNTKNIQ